MNKQHSVYWLFVFKTGHSGGLWALFLSHGNHQKNQSIGSHSGIYLKLIISMVNTKIHKWKNSSLSHKIQYAFTFSLQRETLHSHSVEERNPHITDLPKLLAKIPSMKYLQCTFWLFHFNWAKLIAERKNPLMSNSSPIAELLPQELLYNSALSYSLTVVIKSFMWATISVQCLISFFGLGFYLY